MYRTLTILFIIASSFAYAQDITNTLGTTGKFVLKNSESTELLQISSTGETVLDGNATINGNVTINAGAEPYTLPATDGAANQIIKTDGNGNLGWANHQGYQAIKFLICYNGQFPDYDTNATELLTGQVIMFTGETYLMPKNCLLCNGQLLNIITYQYLFAVIGTKYGGNGTTNFALPNFTSIVPKGE